MKTINNVELTEGLMVVYATGDVPFFSAASVELGTVKSITHYDGKVPYNFVVVEMNDKFCRMFSIPDTQPTLINFYAVRKDV